VCVAQCCSCRPLSPSRLVCPSLPILHLCNMLLPPLHLRNILLRYFKVNYEGTLNVIAACKANGVRKCVMSSSPRCTPNITTDFLFPLTTASSARVSMAATSTA
jgi:hypothetical protein